VVHAARGFTHPDKVMFPADGYSKGQVIEHYRSVAPLILPQLKIRRLTLKLYLNGRRQAPSTCSAKTISILALGARFDDSPDRKHTPHTGFRNE
jgi:hypothetical protein